MTTFNLTCQAVEATLPDYLDETLEPWLRTSIDEHLAGCARCTNLARELGKLAREASGLPPLIPNEDVWPRVARRIGAPAIHSETTDDVAPLAAPLDREVPLPATPSFVTASVPPSWIPAEPLTLEKEARLEASESLLPVREAPAPVKDQPPSFEREVPVPLSDSPTPMTAPTPFADMALAPTSARVYPLDAPRERIWKPRWLGLAAAALVLVTGGTTFLLTVQWLGTAPAATIASEARVGKASSTRVAPKAPVGRPRRGERAQSDPDRLAATPEPPRTAPLPAPLPGDQLSSGLAVSATSARLATRSPENAVYDREIMELQKIVRRQKRDLDTSTVTEIEDNLQALDSAIGQIRAASQEDPGSSMLEDQSSHVLSMKVELLRRAAMMRSTT